MTALQSATLLTVNISLALQYVGKLCIIMISCKVISEIYHEIIVIYQTSECPNESDFGWVLFVRLYVIYGASYFVILDLLSEIEMLKIIIGDGINY